MTSPPAFARCSSPCLGPLGPFLASYQVCVTCGAAVARAPEGVQQRARGCNKRGRAASACLVVRFAQRLGVPVVVQADGVDAVALPRGRRAVARHGAQVRPARAARDVRSAPATYERHATRVQRHGARPHGAPERRPCVRSGHTSECGTRRSTCRAGTHNPWRCRSGCRQGTAPRRNTRTGRCPASGGGSRDRQRSGLSKARVLRWSQTCAAGRHFGLLSARAPHARTRT